MIPEVPSIPDVPDDPLIPDDPELPDNPDVPVDPDIILPDESIDKLPTDVPEVIDCMYIVFADSDPSTEELPLDINPFFILNSFAIITFPIQ